jgi:hypothetical protein
MQKLALSRTLCSTKNTREFINHELNYFIEFLKEFGMKYTIKNV